MKLDKYIVIDFDSTFTKVEAFDELAEISLKEFPDREERVTRIKEITNQGMDGSLSFRESLEQRLHLLSPRREHLSLLVKSLKDKVSNSFQRNREFFRTYADQIYTE
jgi:D-3-phosphoglycerate dehydrogenase / 2-oxoglutarate reductase